MDGQFFAPYDEAFYRQHLDADHEKAYKAMGRTITEVLRPVTVIDVGCGLGNLLWAINDRAYIQKIGIEAPQRQREIAAAGPKIAWDEYRWVDLRDPSFFPTNYRTGSFDLCISVEVAEHLPEESAPGYVKFLTSLSDTILFSAAYPGQMGTGHVNERSMSYWVQFFNDNGFQWDTDTSRRIQSELRGKVGYCTWYERLQVFRRG